MAHSIPGDEIGSVILKLMKNFGRLVIDPYDYPLRKSYKV